MGQRRKPKHSRPVGRPLKLLDEAVTKTLLDALKLGAPIGLACEAASVAPSTFHGWMQRGYSAHVEKSLHDENPDTHEPPDDTETPYVELYEQVQTARASAALRNVGVIQRVANGGTVLERTTEKDPDGTTRVIEKRQAPDWRAAGWFLERSYRGEFRKEAEQVELTGAGGGPVQFTADAKDLAERLSEHLAVGAARTPKAIESTREDVDDDEVVYDAEEVPTD